MDEQEPPKGDTKENLGKKIVDEDFNPPVEMMVHDYDDEQTLDEEEALGALEDPQDEISNLEKEGNMPLEDLMAMYGYDNGSEETKSESSEKKEPSELEQLYADQINVRSTRLGSSSQVQSEDEEESDDGRDDSGRKKTIMVGSDYQAQIPEGLCRYGDALPYENEDKLVWDPKDLSPKEIEDFLLKLAEGSGGTGVSGIPMGNHTRDDEGALYLLLQCGHNVEEAHRRLKLASQAQTSPHLPLWSEDECKNFEAGLRTYGKDFRQIQLNKVRTRSVGELVQFYYLWKKTERHDIFANKARLGKKKYSLHPGVTDYMERFLEGDERQRTDSPSIHSLLYGDPKWKPDEEPPAVKEEKSE